jgi:hypothetical protein
MPKRRVSKRATTNADESKPRSSQAGELMRELRLERSSAKVTSPVPSLAIRKALAREKRLAASPHDLAQQARRIAMKRRRRERSQAGRAEAVESDGKSALQGPIRTATRSKGRAA